MHPRRWLIWIALLLSVLAMGSIRPIDPVAARSAQLPDRATAQPTSTQATPSPLSGSPLTYTVQTGDTFNVVAKRFNLTPAQLAALNQITNTNLLKAGQVLIVGVASLTPAPAPTDTPLPTTTATMIAISTATVTLEAAATPIETATATATPTKIPIAYSIPQRTAIPFDVYLVGGLMVLAVIGLFIGFKTQRR